MKNFNIVTTFLCLWFSVYLSVNIEGYIACFFILSLGLLHGANDLRIIKKVYKKRNLRYYKILFCYVLIVFLGAIIFYSLPSLALILFVLVSGYHFGEQHFEGINAKNKLIKQLLYLSYGCSVIFLLLFCNTSESIDIIFQISRELVLSNLFMYALICSLLFFCFSLLMLFKKIKEPFRELFNLVVFFIVFKTASLIWAFAIYFIIWHSLPSLWSQIKYLSMKVTKLSVLDYIKSSLVYWLLSILGLFIFINFLVIKPDLFYGVFFSFLAAITFPHVIVMTKIFKK